MNNSSDQLTVLKGKVNLAKLPTDLESLIVARLDQLVRITNSPNFLAEFDRLNRYIDWILALPWNKRTEDLLNLSHAREILDKNHYGLTEIKDRIIEYISVMELKKSKGEEGDILRAPILCFVGLVGTGKTTLAYSIAETLGRKFARIPFGEMGDPLDLRGQSKMHPEAEPGKIMKALKSTQSKNSVILLDEIDRVTDQGRAAIMGVLVELLDPEQNSSFVDHYIDFPFDLSEVLFIATANNTTNISTAVLDRLEPIGMPSYTDEEKINIAKSYVLPRTIKTAGINENALTVEDATWHIIVRPLGFDAGIRTLERTIEGIVRKVARKVIEDPNQTFKITPENVKEFIAPTY